MGCIDGMHRWDASMGSPSGPTAAGAALQGPPSPRCAPGSSCCAKGGSAVSRAAPELRGAGGGGTQPSREAEPGLDLQNQGLAALFTPICKRDSRALHFPASNSRMAFGQIPSGLREGEEPACKLEQSKGGTSGIITASDWLREQPARCSQP